VTLNSATGAARFIALPPAAAAAIGQGPASDKANASAKFFSDFGAAVGVSDPAAMVLESTKTDALGETHLTYSQNPRRHPGLRTAIKTHFDAAGRLKAVNGTALPNLTVSPVPSWGVDLASLEAQRSVEQERGAGVGLRTAATRLVVFREGLIKGVPGDNHLAWEIEVTDGAGIRDVVYVGAQTGKVIDTIQGIQDDLFRRAYDGKGLPAPPTNYPNGAFWTEGDHFPTSKEEANNMIVASGEVHGFFDSVFGRDSFDGEGTAMDSIFNRGYSCPNASWNGTFISFCPGFTTDDVTAHEWGHAYTQYTHGLIYQWQPGALNESYSDIWGETVDRINNRGSDEPGIARNANECSSFSPPVVRLRVNSPASIAGPYIAQAASFGGTLDTTGITEDIVAALDDGDAATGANLDGCTQILNAAAVAGKIALVNRGACEFGVKALNAQNAGAKAVIVGRQPARPHPHGPRGRRRPGDHPGGQRLQTTGATLRGALATESGERLRARRARQGRELPLADG
jgi:hypothetical protein